MLLADSPMSDLAHTRRGAQSVIQRRQGRTALTQRQARGACQRASEAILALLQAAGT